MHGRGTYPLLISDTFPPPSEAIPFSSSFQAQSQVLDRRLPTVAPLRSSHYYSHIVIHFPSSRSTVASCPSFPRRFLILPFYLPPPLLALSTGGLAAVLLSLHHSSLSSVLPPPNTRSSHHSPPLVLVHAQHPLTGRPSKLRCVARTFISRKRIPSSSIALVQTCRLEAFTSTRLGPFSATVAASDHRPVTDSQAALWRISLPAPAFASPRRHPGGSAAV